MIIYLKKIFSRQSNTGKTVAYMGFSGVFVIAINMIGGIFVARWLLPTELGLFNSFSIVVSYIILIQAGVPSGLSRQFPFYMGKGIQQKANDIAAVSNFWGLILGVSCLFISFLAAIYFLIVKNYQYSAGAIVIGITTFQALYVTKYLKILYRSNQDFSKLSTIEVINAIISLGGIYFVFEYGFYGLCIRAVLLAIVDFYLTNLWLPVSIKPRWNKSDFKEVMKIGMPIYWVSNIFNLWPTFQRTIVLSLGGTRALGLFALCIIVDNTMNTLSNIIGNISFVRMANAWGAGATFIELLKVPLKLITFAAAINIAASISGWILLPYLINILFPNYIESIEAARWMLIANAVGGLTVFSNVYMVIQKNLDRLWAFLSGIIGWLISIFIFYNIAGFNLIIFPISMIVGYLLILIADAYNFRRYYFTVKNSPAETPA